MSQLNQIVSEVVVRFDLDVPSRDGVILRCNMARPAGDGRWPVIVIRTPYGTAYNVAEGILRARYRHNPEALGAGVPLEPGKPST